METGLFAIQANHLAEFRPPRVGCLPCRGHQQLRTRMSFPTQQVRPD
jgi:hypothetical protein